MTAAPKSLADIDRQYAVHPYTNLSAHQDEGPFVITGGEGIHVFDDQGEKYIEGMAGLWCTSLGFNEQRLVDAATTQMKKMPYSHMFAHRTTEPATILSGMLVDLAPETLTRAFFVNSGSEAVDSAIKMVWYYNNAHGRPAKKKIISRKRAYHGVTIASGSLTGLPYVQDGFDLPAIPALHTDTPHYYREGLENESVSEFVDRLVNSLREMILREGADTIAAFIAEPVMGAGGVLVPPENYFERVQALLKEHDILFIADEVICGFARTGEMFGCDTYNIQPDLMTVAKQLSSAYQPIGAVLISENVYEGLVAGSDKYGVFGTGNTYGGHPVAAAVAIETLKIYAERDIVGHVKSLAPAVKHGLDRLAQHPLVGDARGVGLIGAAELVADKQSRSQFPVSEKIAARVSARARDHQLILRPTPGDAIAFCPPLIINEDDIGRMFDKLIAALDDVHSELAH